jgi:hypothetical protein
MKKGNLTYLLAGLSVFAKMNDWRWCWKTKEQLSAEVNSMAFCFERAVWYVVNTARFKYVTSMFDNKPNQKLLQGYGFDVHVVTGYGDDDTIWSNIVIESYDKEFQEARDLIDLREAEMIVSNLVKDYLMENGIATDVDEYVKSLYPVPQPIGSKFKTLERII